YALLLDRIGLAGEDLPAQYDQASWPAMKERFAAVFRTKTRDEWQVLLEGTDPCSARVSRFGEPHTHSHNVARQAFLSDPDGNRQVAPAPRFSRTPGEARPSYAYVGADTDDVLSNFGIEGT